MTSIIRSKFSIQRTFFQLKDVLKNKNVPRKNVCLMNAVENRSVHSTCLNKDVFNINGADDFRQRVISSKIPVIVNFHADWCEPCHELKPLLESYATEYSTEMHLAEIKADDHPELLQAFDVAAVPAVLAIYRGQVTNKFIGFISPKELNAFIQEIREHSKDATTS